jgi:hypothetical protein
MTRRPDTRETWQRLVNWDKGQTPSERLAAQVLLYDKFESVDPSHPLGGRDGLKDIVCKKGDKKFIVATYFPRGQQDFKAIKDKFTDDANGVEKNKVDGIVFVTNQEIRLGEREELTDIVDKEKVVEIYHLERLNAILNTPNNYGLRLEFLDIEMSKEEQLAYMASKDQVIHDLTNQVVQLVGTTLQKVKQETADAVTVVPTQYQSFYFPGQTKSPIHKCSFCGYGFKIAGRDFLLNSYSGSTAMFIAPSYGQLLTTEVVTCPKCGNTESV